MECLVCFETYEPPPSHLAPVTLPCGHTFCREHAVSDISPSADGGAPQICCHTCRQHSPMPERGSAGLPVNYSLLEVIREQHEQATTEIQRQEQTAPAPEAEEREQWQEQAAPSPEEPAAPHNPVQVEKRVRAISKKLKVAREQRKAKANGQRINVDQKAKIAGIPEMEKELAELEAWRERQRQLSAAAEQHDRGEPSEERLAPEDAGKDDAMKAKTPHSAHAPGENSAADKIGESMAKLSLGEREQEVAGHDGFTADESEALAKLLAADTAQVAQRGDGEDGSKDRDEESAGASGATQADDPSGGARNGAKSSDQRHPRLERQVFVGGLPVDVTSTLFRTWADQVFPGRVINAVLVSA
jgi:hypothetical protein